MSTSAACNIWVKLGEINLNVLFLPLMFHVAFTGINQLGQFIVALQQQYIDVFKGFLYIVFNWHQGC